MRYKDARAQARLRTVIAVCAVCWLFLIAAEWGSPSSDAPSPHGPHAVTAAPMMDSSVVAEHPHLQDESTPSPEMFAVAVMPRLTTALMAVGAIAAAVVLIGFWASRALPTMRGPPRSLATVLTGQQTLTRLCIARR